MSRVVRVGVVGFGNHVIKNVLRCFVASERRVLSKVYVRDLEKYRSSYPDHASYLTDDLEALLSDPETDVIYIATPISSHFGYAQKALTAGKHVWCEKPLTDDVEKTRELAALATSKSLFLGEMSMYRHHRQFTWLKALVAEKRAAGEVLLGARARFSIPPLPADNIRYSRELGGGALLDVGYYPISIFVGLFGVPERVASAGEVSPELGVDLSGSALLHYDGFSCFSFWAIGASYFNEIELSFSKSTVLVERAFSKPADLVTEARITDGFGRAEPSISIEADDQFENMFVAAEAVMAVGDPVELARASEPAVANALVLTDIYRSVYRDAPDRPER